MRYQHRGSKAPSEIPGLKSHTKSTKSGAQPVSYYGSSSLLNGFGTGAGNFSSQYNKQGRGTQKTPRSLNVDLDNWEEPSEEEAEKNPYGTDEDVLNTFDKGGRPFKKGRRGGDEGGASGLEYEYPQSYAEQNQYPGKKLRYQQNFKKGRNEFMDSNRRGGPPGTSKQGKAPPYGFYGDQDQSQEPKEAPGQGDYPEFPEQPQVPNLTAQLGLGYGKVDNPGDNHTLPPAANPKSSKNSNSPQNPKIAKESGGDDYTKSQGMMPSQTQDETISEFSNIETLERKGPYSLRMPLGISEAGSDQIAVAAVHTEKQGSIPEEKTHKPKNQHNQYQFYRNVDNRFQGHSETPDDSVPEIDVAGPVGGYYKPKSKAQHFDMDHQQFGNPISAPSGYHGNTRLPERAGKLPQQKEGAGWRQQESLRDDLPERHALQRGAQDSDDNTGYRNEGYRRRGGMGGRYPGKSSRGGHFMGRGHHRGYRSHRGGYQPDSRRGGFKGGKSQRQELSSKLHLQSHPFGGLEKFNNNTSGSQGVYLGDSLGGFNSHRSNQYSKEGYPRGGEVANRVQTDYLGYSSRAGYRGGGRSHRSGYNQNTVTETQNVGEDARDDEGRGGYRGRGSQQRQVYHQFGNQYPLYDNNSYDGSAAGDREEESRSQSATSRNSKNLEIIYFSPYFPTFSHFLFLSR